MSGTVEVTLPDIGDFEQVDIIEILVAVGDKIEAEDSIITLESDKATMDIPSPYAGVVKELHVNVGDKVSMGGKILKLELSQGHSVDDKPSPTKAPVSEAVRGSADKLADVVVLGAGPGGYTAASGLPTWVKKLFSSNAMMIWVGSA